MSTPGSHSILHNGSFSISQMRKSKLACDLPWREKVREANDRTKYLFNGKELDTETNLYYYGARYFEPKEILWYGVDPLAEKYPFNSGYVYCNGNPVKYVDPDGNAPVYDPEGNLIGTDDEGLQGKALIMNPEDFQQGMSHDEALNCNLGVKGIKSEDAKKKILESYNSLPDRPDWDGVVTDEEAREWWKNGNGETLYIDAGKIDLSPLSKSDFKKENDNRLRFNFFLSPRSSRITARVHGTLTMKLKNRSTGEVGFYMDKNGFFDTYDFNSDGRKVRDVTTQMAKKIVGEGSPYGFKLYGSNPRLTK